MDLRAKRRSPISPQAARGGNHHGEATFGEEVQAASPPVLLHQRRRAITTKGRPKKKAPLKGGASHAKGGSRTPTMFPPLEPEWSQSPPNSLGFLDSGRPGEARYGQDGRPFDDLVVSPDGHSCNEQVLVDIHVSLKGALADLERGRVDLARETLLALLCHGRAC